MVWQIVSEMTYFVDERASFGLRRLSEGARVRKKVGKVCALSPFESRGNWPGDIKGDWR
jgi:hypothetical protein